MATPARVSVLCSGNGSNLQALIDACDSGRIPGKIVRVTVNRKTAYATTRAEKAGIPTAYFNLVKDGFQISGEKDPLKIKEARSKYDSALAERILEDKPELVVLAGWMHIFSEAFLRPLKAVGISVINLHPALPGESYLPICEYETSYLRLTLFARQVRWCRSDRACVRGLQGRQAREQHDRPDDPRGDRAGRPRRYNPAANHQDRGRGHSR